MELTNDCEGCVHVNGYNSNYLGDCENCMRNPKYSDFYFNEKEEAEKDG